MNVRLSEGEGKVRGGVLRENRVEKRIIDEKMGKKKENLARKWVRKKCFHFNLISIRMKFFLSGQKNFQKKI